MNSNPLTSIIVIFLNAEKFLAEAIDSVIAQTLTDWELLLVDDGSTDAGATIALEYERRYPEKVRYLEHDQHRNRGMSVSRNLGLRNSLGKYVALLDADDVWLPGKLKEQVAVLESHPEAAMVYGSSLYWNSWKDAPDSHESDYFHPIGVEPNTIIEAPGLLARFLSGEAVTPCPSDVLIRREILEEVGGFVEAFLGPYQAYEDQAFFAKLCARHPVFVADACWDKYRLHQDSCCSVTQRSGQAQAVRQFYLNWVEGYLTDQKIEDSALWNALRLAQRPYRHPVLYGVARAIKRSLRTMVYFSGLGPSGTRKYGSSV